MAPQPTVLHFCKFIQLIIPTSGYNINKLIKHKMCKMDLSFQNTKNMVSSIKIQGENGKNYSLPLRQFFLNACIFRQTNPLSKT